jgi:propanol-preferring alcohol dehydrogenase
MKAMVLEKIAPIERSPLVLREAPDPVPGPEQVVVEVEACAICRTDLHIIEGDLPRAVLPIIPGHQTVGRVVARGERARRFELGDRIGIAWLGSTCRECEFCLGGRENLCEGSRYTGYHLNGGYAEYAAVNEAYAYAIPKRFTSAMAAPLLCAGIIGYRALIRSNLPRGGVLAMYGFGSSAHITLQMARHRDARVLVATRGESHRELARAMKADWVGDTFDVAPEKADSAIVFAPAGQIVPVAMRALKKGGRVAVAGIHLSEIPPMDYEPHLFHEKELTSVEANTRADGENLLREAEEIPLDPQITTFPFQKANEALQRLKGDAIDGTGVLLMSAAK